MAVRIADTIKPMGTSNFPVTEAADVSIVDHEGNVKRVQDMYDDKELGGLTDPTAANKILVSKEVSGDLVWQEVDADNDELANSAGYQTSNDVSSAISTELTSVLGGNYTTGEFTANEITLSNSSHEVVISPSGITLDNIAYATMNDVAGVEWQVEVVSSLPVSGEPRTMYLVPSSGTSPDIYDEYIWVIVDSTTTPATYGFEKIGSTQLSMEAEDIDYTNVSHAGITNVKGALDDIYEWCQLLDNAITLDIKTFTCSPATIYHEKGSTIAANNLTFTWTVNKPLASQTFNGSSINKDLRTIKNDTQITTTTTYTLQCTSGSGANTQTVSKAITHYFYDSVYYGSSIIGTYDSSFVRALSNSALKANYKGSYPIAVANNEYGFIAFPSSFNAPAQCKIGGFLTEMDLAGTFNVTNASGATLEYKLYKTTNKSLGSITLIYE